ncbi:fructosyl amine: oxygen oxidoreductase [Grosmannia clavigera kw1407]|uniref:Fructosyl amine: oxygen oxidoreductase n=1 Tax=Grosmannia clavigera (strain kw1407 / UAMH 11150) TaxID=655863 RepID=F0XCU3_GROCL|nr:fructosyl amine: oxygen oxidoreductase [Grosmannia clavigera kw1407]EFX03499.1 fructosyl amine: oxygen oxidoreductase [Grosmannia clavigera kw1407]
MLDKQSRIVIVGGGTFGLSAAYHLARSGYSAVTVLEKGAAIPGPQSAANDINKIVRAEYTDPFYSDLALEAISAWTADTVFAPHYHQTGYLLGVSGAAPEVGRRTLALQLESLQSHPAWAGKIEHVRSREDLHRVAPALDGDMPGWSGYFNSFSGYAHSANALRAIHRTVLDLGVQVELGKDVVELIYEAIQSGQPDQSCRCVGVSTATGHRYAADVVILTLGANVGRLLPAVGNQVVAKAWALAHVQLTPDEAKRLRGIPVTFMRDLGFFFEPEPTTGLFKVCAEGAGFSNFVPSLGLSVGASVEDSALLPPAAEAKMRRLLAQALPTLADRPFIDGHLCWCADTADSDYVIDTVPGTTGLVIATGDSGHGFKMLPIAGKWIQEVAEKGHQDLPRWRWKEGADARAADKHRSGEVVDINDIKAKI